MTTKLLSIQQAKFQCPFGHKVQGRRSIRCGHNGQWDGDVPKCEGNDSDEDDDDDTVTISVVAELLVPVPSKKSEQFRIESQNLISFSQFLLESSQTLPIKEKYYSILLFLVLALIWPGSWTFPCHSPIHEV